MLAAIEDRMQEPTARGLADAIGRAVGEGALAPGDRLPPIRSVAADLRLSPTTVSAAWARLIRAGTLRTDGRRGTVVASAPTGPSRYRATLDTAGALFDLDLSSGTPDPQLLPDLHAALLRLEPAATPSTYLDDPVLPALEDAVRADWPFAAERFGVVDGAMDALALFTATHLRYGDRVGVEDPGFPPLLDLLESAGVVAVPLGVDDDGPLAADVRSAARAGVAAIVLQPRAQNPTGAGLTASRAAELADVLRDDDLLVVEDDSAGAVAAGPPISLGAQLPGRVLHVRSYSKSHGPDLRLAALAGPAATVDAMVDRRFLGQGWTSRLLQSLLADLLTDPAARRSVARARREYARRRELVVAGLATHGVPVGGRDGINIWLPVQDESAALLRLAAHGIGASAGRPFTVRPGGAPHLRVTVGLARTDHAGLAVALAAASRAGVATAPR